MDNQMPTVRVKQNCRHDGSAACFEEVTMCNDLCEVVVFCSCSMGDELRLFYAMHASTKLGIKPQTMLQSTTQFSQHESNHVTMNGLKSAHASCKLDVHSVTRSLIPTTISSSGLPSNTTTHIIKHSGASLVCV